MLNFTNVFLFLQFDHVAEFSNPGCVLTGTNY